MDDTANASRVFRFVVTFLVFREGAFDEADHEKGEEACSEGRRSDVTSFSFLCAAACVDEPKGSTFFFVGERRDLSSLITYFAVWSASS
tara:strand:- start:11755 stop:12021 length:267 start_codon:yes stop_codon:yes gene_type:complete